MNKSQLKELIREEVQNQLNEQGSSYLESDVLGLLENAIAMLQEDDEEDVPVQKKKFNRLYKALYDLNLVDPRLPTVSPKK